MADSAQTPARSSSWLIWLVVLVVAGLGAVLLMRPKPSAAPQVTVLVKPSPMHGLEGLALDSKGMLYGASFFGQAIYRVDVKTGAVDIAVASPDGEGDDVTVGPEGTPVAGMLAWTAATEIRGQRPGGKPMVLAPDLPRVNPIAFSKDGRLYTSQSGGQTHNEFWEIDPDGKPPRLINKDQGPLNGFGFGPDGRIYAPLFTTDSVVAVDPETGLYTVIAKGVGSPAAVKVDSHGDLYSVDYKKGDIWHITTKTGEVRKVASDLGVLDNLAIAPDDTVYVSDPTVSSVMKINPADGTVSDVIRGHFNTTLGLALTSLNGKDALLVGDPMGYQFVDAASGAVTRVPWLEGRHSATALAATDKLVVAATSVGLKKIDRDSDQIVAETKDVKAPGGIGLTSGGDVIAADPAGGRIVRWADSGVTPVAEGLKTPTALVLESDTVALVTETDAGMVSRIDLTNGTKTAVAENLGHPQGLVRLPDGRIAVADPAAGTVVAIDLKSGHKTELAKDLKLSVAGLRVPQTTPVGMAAGKDGALYVACAAENSIVRIGGGV